MDPVRQNPIWPTCKPLQRMCNNRMQHITTIRSSLLMFPLTPDQHHWFDVATEDEGWCSFTLCTPSRSRARTYRDWITKSSVLSIGRCNNTKFQQNWLITFAVIMYTDRQNEWQTNPTDRIICALAEKVIRTLRAPNKTIVINYSTYKMLTPGKKPA